MLVTGKAEMRRKRQEFFAEEKLKLVQSMNHVVERFHAEITARCEALDQQRIEAIRDREEQRLLRAVDQFHAMLDDLTAGFESIIHEGVSARP